MGRSDARGQQVTQAAFSDECILFLLYGAEALSSRPFLPGSASPQPRVAQAPPRAGPCGLPSPAHCFPSPGSSLSPPPGQRPRAAGPLRRLFVNETLGFSMEPRGARADAARPQRWP